MPESGYTISADNPLVFFGIAGVIMGVVYVVYMLLHRYAPSVLEVIRYFVWFGFSIVAIAIGYAVMLMSLDGGTVAQTLVYGVIGTAGLISLRFFYKAIDRRIEHDVDPPRYLIREYKSSLDEIEPEQGER